MNHKILFILFIFFIGTISAQLNLQWGVQTGSTSTDWARSMIVDGAGNVITTGYFSGTVDFDPGSGSFTLTSVGTDDMYICKLDANGNFIWAKQFSGDLAYSYDICTDASGNIITTGIVDGTVDFDPGAATNNLTSVGFYSMFVSKLDANGNFIWVKGIGGPFGAEISGSGVATDAAGNIFLTGEMDGYNIDFDPGAASYVLPTFGNPEAFICKLDVNGNFSWATAFIGTSNDEGTGIAIDAAGDVVATGMFANTVDFDPGPGTYNLISTSVSQSDIYICKLTNSGMFVWAKQVTGANSEFSSSITTDALGNIYTAGLFLGVVDVDPGPGTYTFSTASTTIVSNNTFILKLNSAGNFVWAKCIGGAHSTWVSPHTIAVDNAHNVYLNGDFNETIDFDPGVGTYTLNAWGGPPSFVLKLDSIGDFSWAKQTYHLFSSSWNPGGKSMQVDANYNIHLAGYFSYWTVDLDYTAATYNLNTAGAEDILIAKYCQVPDRPGSIFGGTVACTGTPMTFSINPVHGATSYSWSLPAGLSGSSSDYSINATAGMPGGTMSVTAINACGSSLSRTLSILISPSLNISVNSPSICAPGAATLTAGGATSYSWSTGETTYSINPSQAVSTIYTVTGFANGCSSDTKTTVVSLSPVNVTVSVSSLTLCVATPTILTASGVSSYQWSNGSLTSSTSITPIASGNYTVRGSNGACSDTKTIQVTTNPSPTLSVNNGTICAGGTFTMNPSGASTYTFSNGSPTASPSSSTLYLVTGTSSLGCVSPFGIGSFVMVDPLPTLTVNTGTICAGKIFTMNPSGAVSYTFSNGSSTVAPTADDTYTITGSSIYGCLSPPIISSVTVMPLPAVSVNSGSICAGQIFTIIPSGAVSYSFSGNTNTVSPHFTSSYVITGNDAYGCQSSPVISIVTVTTAPVIAVNSGSICYGDTFTLNPSGAVSYTFSGGSSTLSPSSTSSYSITGTSSEGCVSLVIAIATVTVHQLPVVNVSSGSICAGQQFHILPGGAATYTYSGNTSIVSPLTNTDYSVSGTDAFGCESLPVVVTVSVYSIPVISVNSGSICSGESFTIIPAGATSYSYSSGSPLVNPLSTQTYSITGFSPEGCHSLPALSLIDVHALPILNVSSSSSTLCAGESALLFASGAVNYSWSTGENTDTIAVTPLTTMGYTLTGTGSDGCKNSSAITQVVVDCLGLDQNTNFEFRIYPNPTSTELNLETEQAVEIVLINTLGEIVLRAKLFPGIHQLDLNEVVRGMYTLKVSTDKMEFSRKVIKL